MFDFLFKNDKEKKENRKTDIKSLNKPKDSGFDKNQEVSEALLDDYRQEEPKKDALRETNRSYESLKEKPQQHTHNHLASDIVACSDETKRAFEQGVSCYDQKNEREAVECWKRAACNNHSSSLYNLGICFEKYKKFEDAFKCFKRAAEFGHSKAQCNLGYYYMKGLGCTGDKCEAYNCFFSAARKGNATAQCNLGICYISGDGVEKNIAEGQMWLKKAAVNGSAYANNLLKQINL